MDEKQSAAIRLIALDMDGTLLNSKHEISAENAGALRYAHERGVHIAIASGRALFEIEEYRKRVPGVPLHILGLNGAFIHVAGMDDRITYLPDDLFCRCVRMAEARGLRYFFYTDDSLFTNILLEKYRNRNMRLIDAQEALSFAGRAIKFVASSPDRAALAALRADIAKLEVSVCSSWAENFEVNAKGVHKGYALKALAGHLDIPKESVMAVGDQENDIPMLKWAGIPVAMGNAVEAVGQIAVWRTGHHNEHGVARAVYHFLQNNTD